MCREGLIGSKRDGKGLDGEHSSEAVTDEYDLFRFALACGGDESLGESLKPLVQLRVWWRT
jgi:hypothetical protein